MSKEIKIKTEFHAERCEVCHQSDCFNPSTNFCTRCGNLSTDRPLPHTHEIGLENSFETQQLNFHFAIGALGASASILFSGVYISSYINSFFIQEHSVFFVLNSMILSFSLLKILVRRS